MKSYVEYSLGDKNIIVEIETISEESNEGVRRAGKGEKIIEKAKKSFEDALTQIQPMTNIIVNKMINLIDKPSEVNIEFGLKMNAEIGAIIALGGVEANFKVSLKWINQPPK